MRRIARARCTAPPSRCTCRSASGRRRSRRRAFEIYLPYAPIARDDQAATRGRCSCCCSPASGSSARRIFRIVARRLAARCASQAARERAPGAPRPADRAAEPQRCSATAIAAGDPRGAPRRATGRRAAHGPRPLQGGQRHARAPLAATCCSSELGARLRGALRETRHRRPPRRRRVRRSCCPTVAGPPRRRPRSPSASATALEEPFVAAGPAARRRGVDRHRARTRSTATTSDTLIQRADVAMYLAKTASTRLRALRRAARRRTTRPPRRWSASCGARIDESELVALLPAEGRASAPASVDGVEALVRWQHPERGLLAARRVHPARRAHRPDPPADAVRARRRARASATAWRREGSTSRVAVNLSMRNLLDLQLPRRRRRAARQWQLAPARSSSRSPRATIMADPPRHGGARAPQRDGRAALDRRLRHRLLVARLPEAAAGRARSRSTSRS